MSETVSAILPIFLLILTGLGLRQVRLMDESGWRSLDQLSFYLLYPVLLFVTIAKADFAGLSFSEVMLALAAPWAAIAVMLLASRPLLAKIGWVTTAQFSSVFQTSVRWNGFIALAVAERLLDAGAMAIVALVMAALVVPVNIATIYVVLRHSSHGPAGATGTLKRMATNPIVLGCLAALGLRWAGLSLPEPVMTTLDLISRGALAMGLIGIGAGLQASSIARPQWATALPSLLKLVVLPAAAMAISTMIGLPVATTMTIVLCAAVPTAMNGYVVARQLGGDAPLYAAIVTIQTFASFLTIPLFLWIARQLA